MWRLIVFIVAAAGIAVSVWQLERYRSGLIIEPLTVDSTPVTIYREPGTTSAPAIIIAHGFAGSRQLMEAYALTLAQAGYVAVSFDFYGHGAHPIPMTGDVDRIEGTTQDLMRQIGRVTDLVLDLAYVDGRVALLGHSMASDIIVRQAIRDERIKATIAISMFSEAVTAKEPQNLLIITGAWERFLSEEALRAVRMLKPDAEAGETVRDPESGVRRLAVVAPSVEHVGVLYSPTALREARAWLDTTFDRTSSGPVAATGGWIALTLVSIVALAWPLSRLLPAHDERPTRPPVRTFLLAALVPAAITPLILTLFDTRLLPVLVADYLAVHLLVYGLIAIAILVASGIRIGRLAWLSGLALAIYGIAIFGGALDRYAASFVPHEGRVPIILAIAAGAVPYMLADALLVEGGRAAWWRVFAARGAFLASLGVAVALDFERLFFLLIILPVIVVFYAIFGLMGSWVGRRTGSPFASGLGLGLILAWALGVSFPMFSAA